MRKALCAPTMRFFNMRCSLWHCAFLITASTSAARAQVTIAQISDTHLGEASRSPRVR